MKNYSWEAMTGKFGNILNWKASMGIKRNTWELTDVIGNFGVIYAICIIYKHRYRCFVIISRHACKLKKNFEKLLFWLYW